MTPESMKCKLYCKLGIRTILNLQCAKEHDFCGPPLIAHTGFTYDPEIIMGEKVYYFNFAIPDFGTASSKSILDICKVIWFSLTYGRTAVHCHAGLGRTGTLIACFFVWSKGMPNSIQSIDQINIVEEFECHVQKYGTALPSIFFANNGTTLWQLMFNQSQFLPSDEARRYTHIPKAMSSICCVTDFYGRKLQVREMVTAFARITAFPYEKDQALINHFQQLSLIKAESAIAVDEQQIKVEQEIEAVIQTAEAVQNGQTSEQEPETAKRNIHTSEEVHQVELKQKKSDNQEVSKALPNPVTLQHEPLQFELPETVPKDLLEPQTIRQESVNKTETIVVHENGQVNGTEVAIFGTEILQIKEVEEAVRPQSAAAVFTAKNCAKKYGGDSIEQFDKIANEAIDQKTEKENWENYDTLVDLLTFWFTGDNNRDVKQAVYCHMRDLFARNMRQQEQQAAEWRRRMGHHSLKRLL
ncbi:Protein tyrosine phosphatase domain-containing protein 1 [Globodera pallida]|nr:Protein tyrosine phosphatase domain-containing protein 1 [Globodera pallida]